jgi:hypothetical protein
MTRALRAFAVAAVATLSLVLVPAAGNAAGARKSKIIETIWHVTSASGVQTLAMSGSDPDQGLDQFKADITSRWHTTTDKNTTMTFGWPLPKITSNFPDPRTFASIIKPKVVMTGSANGQMRDANNNPVPFSCIANTGKNPENFLPVDTVPISGGTIRGTRLGIGAILHSDPRVLFDTCPAPEGGTVLSVLSPEQINLNKPTYLPIPANHVKRGHRGEKLTLHIKVTTPIKSSTGAQVGTLTSTAHIHLKFGTAV